MRPMYSYVNLCDMYHSGKMDYIGMRDGHQSIGIYAPFNP